MIMVALNGANSRIVTISSMRCELSPTFVCKSCANTSGAFHVQHIATFVCQVVRRDCSAIKFDRTKIAFILASFRWLKPLTAERREETRVRVKTLDDELKEKATHKSPN